MKIEEILKAVTESAKQSDKIKILKDNRSELLDMVFDYAYNPDKMFGVTSNQIIGNEPVKIGSAGFDDLGGLVLSSLYDLYKRTFTGNAAIAEVLRVMEHLNVEARTVMLNILDKNLKVGVSLETYQKEVMGIKPTKFEVTLAQHLEDVKGVNPLDGSWWASRKCDGVRCVAFYDSADKSVEFYSRQGKKFTTLDKLVPAVQSFCKELIGKWVLDGELCKIDENGDEHFEQIVGECKKKNYTIEDCCYQLFDIVQRSVFDGTTKDDRNFESRHHQLVVMEAVDGKQFEDKSKGCWVKVLEQERITNHNDFARWSKKVADGNWEGFMLRKDVPFEKGRTKNLLKVKEFHDAEYKVLGVITGKITSAEPGQGNVEYEGVKALVIEHKGSKVQVGSGITKEQRKDWCINMDHIIGKTICVKYFQESQDKDGKLSLRFPTLKYVYEGERNV